MMRESKFLLRIIGAVVLVVVLAFLHHFLSLLFLPLLVDRFLLVGEQGHDLAVGILLYSAAGAAVGARVARWVVLEAVHGDCPGDEDDLELKYLILCEVELIFERSQLPGGSFRRVGFFKPGLDGSIRRLGVDKGMEAGDEQD
jgi:hypothetical protein